MKQLPFSTSMLSTIMLGLGGSMIGMKWLKVQGAVQSAGFFLCSVQTRNVHVWTLVFQCPVTSVVYLDMLEELFVLIMEEESPMTWYSGKTGDHLCIFML